MSLQNCGSLNKQTMAFISMSIGSKCEIWVSGKADSRFGCLPLPLNGYFCASSAYATGDADVPLVDDNPPLYHVCSASLVLPEVLSDIPGSKRFFFWAFVLLYFLILKDFLIRKYNGKKYVRGLGMEYISVKEASDKWGVTIRMVNYYCAAGRIKGAQKIGNMCG